MKYILLTFAAAAIIASGCGEKKKEEPKKEKKDSTETVVEKPARKKKNISYTFLTVENISMLDTLKNRYGVEGKKTILALNRLDSKNIRKKDSLIIPDKIYESFIEYSPFPFQLEIADSIQKLLIFSYPIQAFAAYEKGLLVRWGPTSLGKKTTLTPTGLYHTNWKSKLTRSTVDSTWILPYAFNLDNFNGISIHEFDMPGYPASHACARLLEEDAKWIYNWAKQWILNSSHSKIIGYGTPVIIYGEYDFKSPPPWITAAAKKEKLDIDEMELEKEIEPYLEKILNRQQVRDSLDSARDTLAVK